MGSAGVTRREVDLSTRIPAFPGVSAGIVIPALKGPLDEATLITSETQFLKRYTPDEKVGIGFDLSHYSALAYLQQSNSLWVVRVANTPLSGGVIIYESWVSASNFAVAAGQSDPTAYSFSDDELLFIYGKNPGAWNNDIYIKLTTNATDSDKVPEPNAFLIEVFKTGDLVNPIESWVCSRDESHIDGFGRNIYIETVLEGSEYIGATDNTNTINTTQPKDQLTVIQFENGSNGITVTDSGMIAGAVYLTNPESVQLTILMDGGWTTTAYQAELNRIAALRDDCVAILSSRFVDEANASYINAIKTYRQDTLNLNSSYSAIFSPHPQVLDKFNDRNLYVPPDGYAAAVISKTAANRELWFPPAGFRRGIINVLDLRRRFTKGEMDTLYDIGVNPLRFAPGRGILVWGQKTLLSRPSALDRLNVRLLLVIIKPAITIFLEDFVFEINDVATRSIITAIIESYLENIKSRRGLYDYQIICDTTNNTDVVIDNNELHVWVFVKPVRAAEFIKFTTIITATSISFQLAAESI